MNGKNWHQDLGKQISDYDALVQENSKHTQLGGLLSAVQARHKRKVLQFDSPVMVIVSMGMLKAGKSTLTNLMARTPNASPVGYGYDTTLRPALIRMCRENEKPGITVYKDCNASALTTPEERDEMLRLILDILRGLPPEGDTRYHGRLTFETLDLTQDNLRRTLCTMPAQEPLLVVVSVPHNEQAKMLQGNRMLMDMPGLDSGNSKFDLSDYAALIEQCDMVLFVQSTVAPLNEAACNCLKQVSSRCHSSTTRIILNRMQARPWLDASELQKDEQLQRKHAWETVLQASHASYDEKSLVTANLGMAYDALDLGKRKLMEGKDAQDLLAESSFLQLEDSLVNDLNANGAKLRFNHCKTTLANLYQDLVAKIRQSRNQLQQQQDAYRARLDMLLQLAKGLDLIPDPGKQVGGSMDFMTPGTLEHGLTKAYNDALAKFPDLKNPAIEEGNGSLVDDFLQKAADAGADVCCKLLSGLQAQDLQLGGKRLHEYCMEMLGAALDKWENSLDAEKKDILKKAGLRNMAGIPRDTPVRLKNIDRIHFRFPATRTFKQPYKIMGIEIPFREDDVPFRNRGVEIWKGELQHLLQATHQQVERMFAEQTYAIANELIQNRLAALQQDVKAKLQSAARTEQERMDNHAAQIQAMDAAISKLNAFCHRINTLQPDA